MADTFDLLRRIVNETKCWPGMCENAFEFKLIDDVGALRLIITIDGYNNYDRTPFMVCHSHPVPTATYNEATWRRWIFDQLLRSMTHELGEALNFNGVRPFAPMHGPGEDPYTIHEIRPEVDALTRQDGSIRPGPV